MAFPAHRDHDAYGLIKTQLHNSKTLRRKELKIEKESLWYDTKFCICNKGVYLYIWILCALVSWCQVWYLLRETFLYPLQRRDRQRTQLRGTLTEISVHDVWVLSSPIPRHVWEWNLSHSVYVFCFMHTDANTFHSQSNGLRFEDGFM